MIEERIETKTCGRCGTEYQVRISYVMVIDGERKGEWVRDSGQAYAIGRTECDTCFEERIGLVEADTAKKAEARKKGPRRIDKDPYKGYNHGLGIELEGRSHYDKVIKETKSIPVG